MQMESDETSMFAMAGGCPVHGDDFIQECSVCGQEYCAKCHPGSTCPACSVEEKPLDDDLLEEEPSTDPYLDALIDDEELEKLLKEGEELPPEDIMDDDLR